MKTKTLHLRVYVDAYMNGTIQVPASMNKDEAFEYAQNHQNDIDTDSNLIMIPYSEELDAEEIDNPHGFYFTNDAPDGPSSSEMQNLLS